MEVSQPVVSEASIMTVDPSVCVHAEHTGADTVAESGGEELTAVSAGGVVYASVDGSIPGCGNVHSQDVNSVTLNAAQSVAYESKPEVTAVADGENVVNNENPADMHGHSVGYESVNGSAGELGSYQSSGAIENGIPSNEAGAPAAEQHLEDVNSAEEDRLWSIEKANCLDFNAWTTLIDETERVSENNIQKIRKVYDAFLAEFPLCFGYWKKYADHEGRLDSVNRVVEVYERAVHAVTYSVDIWLHYCVFAISTYEDPDTIRRATLMSGGKPMCSPPFQGRSMSISSGRLFERGLAFVGSDYLSYPLWDEYIRYEEAQQAWLHLAMIYTRILENPIQQLDRYFLCLKDLAASRPLSEIRIAEEVTVVAASMNTDNPCLEGELRPDGAEQSPKPVDAGLTEVEELEKYIAAREELYKKAKELESKIIGFETAIRRPYFHVRPLDDPELENWHNYLDFIEKENDINKVIKLYERCLIACANYPEFWIRYALYMESSGNMELAYNALARATHCFVKKQPEIHLFAARFKELCGDIEGARAEYELLYSEISPCLLEGIIKNANMEYRVGNKEAAYSIYEKIIAAEKEKEHSRILPMLLVQYSRFLYLVTGDLEKARDVLFGSLGQVQLSKSVIEAVIHLEIIQPQPKRIDYLDSLVEKFILPNSDNTDVASTTDREEISCIFLEFLDLFGDVQSIKKADNRHAKLFLLQKSSLVSKKRQAEDSLATDKTKVSRTSTDAASSGQSVVGAYPNAQNQWTSGYAQRAPWPQNSQVQGQQWSPGYAPQAAYNAYGYANYGAPQIPMPTSAPQTAVAYGSYPPAYPAQGYPQQTYAQPSPVVATYPQQGSAPPQYYGSYY